ncbi:hypothetical protein N6H14_17195 [Paenibacillus sp. CC-CFT747]|nr:hypothetical protein N6H14_17195 [Paenibacillus sp. CC-CFT747]
MAPRRGGGDYRLHPVTAQAAIDTGVALPVEVPVDFEGNPRPMGLAYDIGAIETRVGAPSISVDTTAWTKDGVTVTIQYPAGAVRKEYRIGANSEWMPYEGPIVLSANGVVYARGVDASGHSSDVASYAVGNIDKTGPQLSVQLDKTTLWPANHKLVTVNATWNASDTDSGLAGVVLHSVVSNDLKANPSDIQAVLGAPTTSFQLRAEREGTAPAASIR